MMRAIAALAAVLTLGLAAPALAELRVGVVDLNAISERYEKHKEEVTRLQAERDRLVADLAKMDEQIKGLQERRQLFGEDSDEYNDITGKLEEFKMQFMLKKNTLERQIEKRQLELIKALYRDIQDAVREWAAANGFHLILVKAGDQLMSTKLQEVVVEIRLKPVLFAAPELDVTAPIIDYMNAKFRRTR
ncbi:MAG: OmpH family outer membrane protein [Planctomycetota bacterium]